MKKEQWSNRVGVELWETQKKTNKTVKKYKFARQKQTKVETSQMKNKKRDTLIQFKIKLNWLTGSWFVCQSKLDLMILILDN